MMELIYLIAIFILSFSTFWYRDRAKVWKQRFHDQTIQSIASEFGKNFGTNLGQSMGKSMIDHAVSQRKNHERPDEIK